MIAENTPEAPRGIAHINPAQLNKRNRAALNAGMSACAALWQASDDRSLWKDLYSHPLLGCILATHALIDVWNVIGPGEARIRQVGFQYLRHGNPPRAVTVGARNASFEPGRVNAHFVVTTGEVLLDPSHGQVRREWNSAPDFAAFWHRGPFKVQVPGEVGEFFATSRTQWGPPMGGAHCEYEVLYYELPREVRKRIRGWENSPDMALERRAPIVRRALEILGA